MLRSLARPHSHRPQLLVTHIGELRLDPGDKFPMLLSELVARCTQLQPLSDMIGQGAVKAAVPREENSKVFVQLSRRWPAVQRQGSLDDDEAVAESIHKGAITATMCQP